jgi:ankyrin repeat protein
MRAAAGLGRVDLLEDGVGGAARGFYRPHSGFPDWQPGESEQEVLDEALVWAAKTGAIDSMDWLLRAGARIDADPYRGTPLIWAAFCNRVEAAEWLVAHGAEVNLKATFGGLTHGQGITALHLAAQNGHLEMVQALIRLGADRKIKEDLYGSDAAGAAKFFGQEEVWSYLNELRN